MAPHKLVREVGEVSVLTHTKEQHAMITYETKEDAVEQSHKISERTEDKYSSPLRQSISDAC